MEPIVPHYISEKAGRRRQHQGGKRGENVHPTFARFLTSNPMEPGPLLYRDSGTIKKMQMLLTSVVLMLLLCNGLCSAGARLSNPVNFSFTSNGNGNPEQEKVLLRSILASKVKAIERSAPLWQLSLQDVCGMLSSLGTSWRESWSSEEERDDSDSDTDTDYEQRVSDRLMQTLQEMRELQNFCRVLQPRQLHDAEQEYVEENSDRPLKRKSPYILKRQLRTNKSRRPYILKRSAYY